MLQALLAQLARTPAEHADFWANTQREQYEKCHKLEAIISTVQGESADLAEQALADLHRIRFWQSECALIRDRIADEQEQS